MTTPIKTENGWYVDFRASGRGSTRHRKSFKTKTEALSYINHVKVTAETKPWLSQRDNRRLSELVGVWYSSYGLSLEDGENRNKWLLRLCDLAGDPLGVQFDAKLFNRLRKERLELVGENTANHDLAYLRAMFNKLIELGEVVYPNPLDSVSQLKFRPRELRSLSDDEISRLLEYLKGRDDKECFAITICCLSTGARWREIENITRSAVENSNQIRVMGKNGKHRYLPIQQAQYDFLSKFWHAKIPSQRIFSDQYNAFRYALKVLQIEVPRGQLTHVLRHTFATHFLSQGGDIRELKRILDHQDIRMTMRYAHTDPAHFEQALTKNPVFEQIKSL